MIGELRTVLPYIRKRLWWYILGVISLLITSGVALLIPQFIKTIINTLASGIFTLNELLPYLGGILLVACTMVLGRMGWRFLIVGAARRVEAELRETLFSHMLTLGKSFFQKQKIGDLMALSTNDLNAVRMAVSMAFIAGFDGLFLTVSVLIILFGTNPTITLICIIPLPLITFIIFSVGTMIGKMFKSVQESFGTLTRQTQEVFSGMKVIQSFAKEPEFAMRFARANDDYQTKNLALVSIWGMVNPVVGFLSGLTTVLLIRFGGEAVLGGSFSPGDLVATISYLQLLIWPMLGAGYTVNMLQRGAASMNRINEVLREQPDVSTEKPVPLPEGRGTIELRNLHFTYPGRSEPALAGISVQVPEGSWLGITGPIGSGKTTLLNALLRLYPVQENMIFVNSADVCSLNVDELRSCFAVVPQETFLFSDSLRNNIAFGSEDALDEHIFAAAEVSTIDRDVRQFPQGWDTEVGERGITLSGGQKLRIAISRAILCNAPILILDDSFASVDAETERWMIERIHERRADHTTIIVSHRISAIAGCDHIVVLEHGVICQSGTHSQLISDEGFYQDMYRLQGMEHGGAS